MADHDIGTGWAFPLAITPSGGVETVSGTRRLEQSMRLILTTYPGERAARPDFGSRLRDFVFRDVSLDTAADLAAEVRTALELWEPRVDVLDVLVLPDADEPALLFVDIRYRVRADGVERTLVFPFSTLPEGGD